jgi:hypothetical protein
MAIAYDVEGNARHPGQRTGGKMSKMKTLKSKSGSGGARLMRSGKKPVLLGISPEDHRLWKLAASLERRPLTQYIVFHMARITEENLKKSGKIA